MRGDPPLSFFQGLLPRLPQLQGFECEACDYGASFVNELCGILGSLPSLQRLDLSLSVPIAGLGQVLQACPLKYLTLAELPSGAGTCRSRTLQHLKVDTICVQDLPLILSASRWVLPWHHWCSVRSACSATLPEGGADLAVLLCGWCTMWVSGWVGGGLSGVPAGVCHYAKRERLHLHKCFKPLCMPIAVSLSFPPPRFPSLTGLDVHDAIKAKELTASSAADVAAAWDASQVQKVAGQFGVADDTNIPDEYFALDDVHSSASILQLLEPLIGSELACSLHELVLRRPTAEGDVREIAMLFPNLEVLQLTHVRTEQELALLLKLPHLRSLTLDAASMDDVPVIMEFVWSSQAAGPRPISLELYVFVEDEGDDDLVAHAVTGAAQAFEAEWRGLPDRVVSVTFEWQL